MTVRKDLVSYLVQSPDEPVVDPDKGFKSTPNFGNWFNSITRVLGYAVGVTRFISSKQQTPISVVISFPTIVERDDLQNPPPNTWVYIESLDEFHFRKGASWVTFAPIPA